MACLLRLLRGEDADVAGSYLASGRARSGADGRLGHPGGRAAEARRLRPDPLLARHVPGCLRFFAPLVFALSVIAIIYTSLVALMQDDIKKLIAYSSVAHMGYVTMGIFAANAQGLQGSIFQMLSHGIVSGALFLCVGVVYDRTHTREIAAYGGLVNNMPKYAVAMMVFTMANVGLPGTSGFIGEFLTLIGVFRVNTWVALFAATGVILSAAYALWLYRRVIFGALERKSSRLLLDLSPARTADPLPADRTDHLLRRLSGSGLRCDRCIG